jgi:hypothetical protein
MEEEDSRYKREISYLSIALVLYDNPFHQQTLYTVHIHMILIAIVRVVLGSLIKKIKDKWKCSLEAKAQYIKWWCIGVPKWIHFVTDILFVVLHVPLA